jgi:hypothetical protein
MLVAKASMQAERAMGTRRLYAWCTWHLRFGMWMSGRARTLIAYEQGNEGRRRHQVPGVSLWLACGWVVLRVAVPVRAEWALGLWGRYCYHSHARIWAQFLGSDSLESETDSVNGRKDIWEHPANNGSTR